jgi:type IV pilus assembly protein PilQ
MLLLSSAAAEQNRSSNRVRRALPTKRIDVSLHNADIQNVLRLFAEIGRINIVYGEDVSGTVTISLKRVRWDHALFAILRSKGLDMTWEDNIIRVAKAETLAKERQRQVDTREHCLQTSPLITRIIPVSYANASDMVSLVQASLQSPRGSVTVDERTNALIVRDVDCR